MAIALFAAKTIELQLFHDDIKALILKKALSEQDAAKIPFIDSLTSFSNQQASLRAEVADLKSKRESAYQEYKCECDGTCGSGTRGRGSDCERMELRYLQINRAYLSKMADAEVSIRAIDERVVETNALMAEAVDEIKKTEVSSLSAKLLASRDLPAGPLILMFVIIGVAGILIVIKFTKKTT